jgi:hypothetical protein
MMQTDKPLCSRKARPQQLIRLPGLAGSPPSHLGRGCPIPQDGKGRGLAKRPDHDRG